MSTAVYAKSAKANTLCVYSEKGIKMIRILILGVASKLTFQWFSLDCCVPFKFKLVKIFMIFYTVPFWCHLHNNTTTTPQPYHNNTTTSNNDTTKAPQPHHNHITTTPQRNWYT